jgi:hypothetical protein
MTTPDPLARVAAELLAERFGPKPSRPADPYARHRRSQLARDLDDELRRHTGTGWPDDCTRRHHGSAA